MAKRLQVTSVRKFSLDSNFLLNFIRRDRPNQRNDEKPIFFVVDNLFSVLSSKHSIHCLFLARKSTVYCEVGV